VSVVSVSQLLPILIFQWVKTAMMWSWLFSSNYLRR